MPGFANLRDVGGYRIGATATARWRSLLRADMPHEPVDLRALADVPVGTVIDLREDDEALETASVFVERGFHVVRRPVFGGTAESFVSRRVRLTELYTHVVTACAPGLTDAVRAIADAEASSAVLVHCTAGKDRTGLTVALALRAVGVDRRDVVSDYVATEARLRGPWRDRRLAELEEHHGADLSGSSQLLFGSPGHAFDHALDLDRHRRSHPHRRQRSPLHRRPVRGACRPGRGSRRDRRPH
ncbi:tyrosine-protein phosphatase [Cellulomonas chengniuliangii]|uniref:Tyrosine-protein phosphatase n=1 Tax=Cellulomonas chengniuliangii TaxID=2968084 RepID=A0ABY5KX42_9CELL|nr:tyrosine-protein phosphatase [Cellulomonas chengniuliangii]MCC2309372.1 tyrosine-protein phosphatase [Cellulomonas chengniuliangii]UUI75061.1 tyrosine-protein phosphatase [Cellulomonas chengniuliangii]